MSRSRNLIEGTVRILAQTKPGAPILIETCRQVEVPGVGALVRVELLSEGGESLGIEYRRPFDHIRRAALKTVATFSPIPLAD